MFHNIPVRLLGLALLGLALLGLGLLDLGMTEIDKGLWAFVVVWRRIVLLRAFGGALLYDPEPWVVIDNLHFVP